MKSFDKLLAEVIKEEIDSLFYLVYVPTIISSRKYLKGSSFRKSFDKAINKDKYDLDDILIMIDRKMSESDMFDVIKNFCGGRGVTSPYEYINRIDIIPMFKYFIDKDIYTPNLVIPYFFPIHCSGQVNNVFLDSSISPRPNFDAGYTLIAGTEHLLGAKDSRFTLSAAIYCLKFINYERRNRLINKNSEYFNRLDAMGLKLEEFLSFYGSDELIEKYNASKNGTAPWMENYSESELDLSLNNFNLIKHFYNDSIPNYANKFYLLKDIEKKMANSSNKKELLLAAFCYREYCDDDFFKSFGDVELTVDDLASFISECEKANLKITDRQIGNLLKSFKKYYLVKNNLVEEHVSEKSHILEAYDKYCANNWVFEESEFVDFYNSLYGKKLKSFNFEGNEEPLTIEILDEVIGNGKFAGLEKIMNAAAVFSYFNNRIITDRESYCHDVEHRKDIFEKYYSLISGYCRDPQVTMHYFIYRCGFGMDDEKTAEDLIQWCSNSLNLNADFYSEELKRNTDMEIRNNCTSDFLTNFKDRTKIRDRYYSIVEKDDITKFGATYIIKNSFGSVQREVLSKLNEEVITRARTAIDDDESIFDDLPLSEKEIKSMLTKANIDWKPFFDSTCVRYDYMTPLRRRVIKALDEYTTSDCSILDVCNKYGCLPDKMRRYVSLLREDKPELFEKYNQKVVENNDYTDNSYIDTDHIIDGMNNGVIMPNGTVREYNLFDLIRDVGHNVNILEMKRFLNQCHPDSLCISPFFGRYPFIDLREEQPFPRQIRNDTMIVNVDGEQHLVTDEEREAVLKYLEERDLPSCLYSSAVKSYLNGEFDLNEKGLKKTEVKVKVKTEN